MLRGVQSTMGEETGVLMNTFLANSASLLADLGQAVDQHNPERLKRAAHTLVSSSHVVGALALAAQCRELENAGDQDALDIARVSLPRIKAEHGRLRTLLEAQLGALGEPAAPPAVLSRG